MKTLLAITAFFFTVCLSFAENKSFAYVTDEQRCGLLWERIDQDQKIQENGASGSLWNSVAEASAQHCISEDKKRPLLRKVLRTMEADLLTTSKNKPNEHFFKQLEIFIDAEISAEEYEEITRVYGLLKSEFADRGILTSFYSNDSWWSYFDKVMAASMARGDLTFGKTMAKEMLGGANLTLFRQAKICMTLGELFLSKEEVEMAAVSFRLALALNSEGEGAEKARYWLAIDSYARADLSSVHREINQLKQFAMDSKIQAKALILERAINSEKSAIVSGNNGEAQVLELWHDIDLMIANNRS